MSSLWNKVADTFNRERNGTVPKAPSGSGTNHYLCEDGTWKEVESGGAEIESITYDYYLAHKSEIEQSDNAYIVEGNIPFPTSYYHEYSTQEHIVGKWIDSKTIYEKTISSEIGNTNTTNYYTDDDIGKIDKVLWLSATSLLTSAQYTGSGIFNVGNSVNNVVKMFITDDVDTPTKKWLNILNYNASAFANKSIYITLQYTRQDR